MLLVFDLEHDFIWLNVIKQGDSMGLHKTTRGGGILLVFIVGSSRLRGNRAGRVKGSFVKGE